MNDHRPVSNAFARAERQRAADHDGRASRLEDFGRGLAALIPSMDPPTIPHRERADVVLDISPLVPDYADALSRKLSRSDLALRSKIAVLYPPLPSGYVWVQEIMYSDRSFGEAPFSLSAYETISIRYWPMHRDDMPRGAVVFRP